MACFHPLFGQKFYRPDGKCDVKIFGSFYDFVGEGCFISMDDFLDNPDFVKIPCGQCVGCRLEYSRQWAIRCVLESKLHPPMSCWFLTFPYADHNKP